MSTATPTRPDDQSTPDTTRNSSPDLLHDESTASLNGRLHPDLFRTLIFIIGAVACLAITAGIEFSSRPAEIQDFGKVGEEFYADFTDPTLATSLEVYVFDADAVKLQDFRVERLDNGRWVIPSHHNYPADAEDELAETASSIIGIQRGAMVTRWESDHARYGVVNPKQKSLNVKEVEGVGSRIILRGADNSVLADYIIGNKVDGEFDQYYVRHPEEDDVYIAELKIDLSTKFADWIETDLLEIDRDDVIGLTLNDYSFDELKGQVTDREISSLKREKFTEPWTLDGLDEETEEVNKDKLRDIVNAVADMKIAGVRPKQRGLTPELTLDREVIKSQKDVDRIQTDLLTRGFVLQPAEGDGDRLRLIAREGELSAATDEGLVYHLHFGRVFTGSQEELETGLDTTSQSESLSADDASKANAGTTKSSSDSAANPTDSESAGNTNSSTEDGVKENSPSEDEASNDDDDKSDSSKPGRYAFVRVEFDEQWLAQEPVKPTEPEKPAELVAADSASAPNDTADTPAPSDDESNSSPEDAGERDRKVSTKKEDNESRSEDEEDPLAEIRRKYEDAKSKYESDLAEYERKKKEREDRIEEGQKKAEKLNRRFAEWYYVIPGDDFDDITLARADIIKTKEPETKEDESSSDTQSTSASEQDSGDETSESEPASQSEPVSVEPRRNINKEAADTTPAGNGSGEKSDDQSEANTGSAEASQRDKTKVISDDDQATKNDAGPLPENSEPSSAESVKE